MTSKQDMKFQPKLQSSHVDFTDDHNISIRGKFASHETYPRQLENMRKVRACTLIETASQSKLQIEGYCHFKINPLFNRFGPHLGELTHISLKRDIQWHWSILFHNTKLLV